MDTSIPADWNEADRTRQSEPGGDEACQRRLADFAKASSDWFWEMGPDLRFIWFSEQFEAITGIAADRLIGRTRDELGASGADPEAWQAHLADLRAHRPFRNFRYRMTIAGERELYTSTSGLPVFAEDGTFLGYRGASTDITDICQAERRLRFSRASIDHSLDAMLWVRADGSFFDVNTAACRSLGYSRDELIGLSVFDIDPEIARESWPQHWQDVKEKGSERLESRHRRKDGSEFPVDVHIRFLTFEGEEYHFTAIRDISERRRSETALRESEGRFRALVDNSPGIIYIKDIDGRYALVNKALERTYGIAATDIVGKTVSDLLGIGDAEAHLRHDREALNRGTAVTHQHQVRLPDGSSRSFLKTKFPLTDGSGRRIGLAGIDIDITEQVEAEREATAARAMLVDAIESINEGFAIYDADDRLLLCNEPFKASYPTVAEEILPGVRFEELLRSAVARGQYPDAVGREEAWIAERIRIRRQGQRLIEHKTGDGRWLLVSDRRSRTGNLVSLRTDITERKRSEELIASLAEAVSATVGAAFAEQLVRSLTEVLGVEFAFISEISPEEPDQLQTVAVSRRGKLVDGFAYSLEGTPCVEILCGGTSVHERNVKALFPDSPFLVDNAIESLVGSALTDSSGRPIGALVIADTKPLEKAELVTAVSKLYAARAAAELERQHAAQALQNSERRFKDFAAAASDWFWEAGPDLRFTWLSTQWRSASNIPPEQIIGKTREELAGAAVDHPAWQRHLADLRAHRPFKDFRYQLTTVEGEPLWISVSGVPVFGEDGAFQGYRGTGSNVTGLVLAERAADRARALLEDAMESITDGFAVFDREDKLVLFNGAYREALATVADLLRPGVRWEDLMRALTTRGEYVVPEGETHDQWIEAQVARHREGCGVRLAKTCDGRWIEVRDYRTREGGTVVLRVDITERREAEAALRKSEQRLATAQHIARLGTWEWNIASGELTWSAEVYRIFRIAPSRFEGNYGAFLKAVHPDDRERVTDAVEAALHQGMPYNIEHRILRPNGEERIVHEEAEVTFDAAGKAVRMIGTVQDITERARAEEALRKLSQALEQGPVSVVITDTDGTIEYVNPRFEQVTGYAAEEAIGNNPRILKSGEMASTKYRELWQTIRGGDTWEGEFHNRRKSGELFWEKASIGPIKAPDGTITHFVAIKEDITARKAAEQAVRHSTQMQFLLNMLLQIGQRDISLEEKLALDLDVVLNAKWLRIERRGAIFLADEEGRKLRLAVGRNFPSELETLCARVPFGHCLSGRAAASGEVQFADCVDERHDNHYPGMASHGHYLVPITADDKVRGVLFLCGAPGHAYSKREERFLKSAANVIGLTIARDQARNELIRHRDRLQEAVGAATREIQIKAEELEAALAKEREFNLLQRQFVSMASHELRTPLTIIDSTAQRIERRLEHMTAEDLAPRLGKIRGAVKRMTALIESTLSAARMDAGKISVSPQRCDLRAVINEACQRQQEIAASHHITVDLAALPAEMTADAKALDQVFTNLLSNAVKYAPGAPDIEVVGWTEGKCAVIAVRDHGLGIPAAELPSMFERFFRASTSAGIAGTGIGLNLVKQLVEMHGGSIAVDSVEGEGSTFTVRLPLDPVVAGKPSNKEGKA